MNGRTADDVAKDVQVGLDKIAVPNAYKVTQGGEAQSQNESFGQILSALGLSGFLAHRFVRLLVRMPRFQPHQHVPEPETPRTPERVPVPAGSGAD